MTGRWYLTRVRQRINEKEQEAPRRLVKYREWEETERKASAFDALSGFGSVSVEMLRGDRCTKFWWSVLDAESLLSIVERELMKEE